MTKAKLKFLILSLFLFVIWSCTDDYENVESLHIHNHKGYTIKKYSYKQALKLSKFQKANKIAKQELNLKFSDLKNFKNSKFKRTDARDAALSFAIDSTLIKEVTKNNVTTYTMLIALDTVDYSNNSFDNLIVKIDSLNNTSSYIIHYTPTEESVYNTTHNSYTFQGDIELSKVYGITTFGGGGSNLGGGDQDYNGGEAGGGNTNTWDSVICVTLIKCNYLYPHIAGPGCANTYSETFCYTNPNYNPWGGSGNTPEDEDTLGGNNYIGNGSGGGSSSSSNTNNTVETITTTVTLGEIGELNDDCSLFTNLQSDFEVKSLIEYMKTQTSDTIEKGMCLSATTTTGQYSPIVGVPDQNLDYAVGYDIPNGTVVDILIHTHYTGGLSIFSPHDLQQIYIMMKNPNITIPDNFVSIVVTPDNEVFAMTISSKSDFLAFGNKWFPDDEKFETFENLFYTSIVGFNINGNNSNSSNEINFLKMLGSKSGIKLYKANSDLSQWDNLKVNSINNSVTQTSPCN